MSPMQLIPIANLMETKVYKLGDIILKEAEPQKYFYLIAKGRYFNLLNYHARCKVIKEEVVIRDKKKLGMSKTKKKERLNFGITDYKKMYPSGKEKQRVRFNYQNGYKKEDKIQKNETKSFQYEKILDDEGHLAFKYHFNYDDLVRGDFFMGRALLSEYKQLEPSLNELPFDTEEPARLTVVSDAAVTEVYVLEKTLLHIIPFPLKVSYYIPLSLENAHRRHTLQAGVRYLL